MSPRLRRIAARVAGATTVYKGMKLQGDRVTVVPGFCSTRVAEAAEYAVPAIYTFSFDLAKLHHVETVNGMDDDPEIRALEPGAIGKDDPHEFIINEPVEMLLLKGTDLVDAISHIPEDTVSSDPIQTLSYIVETTSENAQALGLDEAMLEELHGLLNEDSEYED